MDGGKKVHAAIAHIAEQHLTPKAKKTVDQILEGKNMAYYAAWPDFYRKEMTVDHIDENGKVVKKMIPHTFNQTCCNATPYPPDRRYPLPCPYENR